jgi:hypothetical protein
MKHQLISNVFYAWYDQYAEIKRAKDISDRALRKMLNMRLHGMFRTWHNNANELKTQRRNTKRVLARIQLASEARCFHRWEYFVQRRQRAREQVSRSMRKWTNQNLTLGWRTWNLFVKHSNLNMQRKRTLQFQVQKLKIMFRVLREKFLLRSMTKWREVIWHTRMLEQSNTLKTVHAAHVQHIENNVIRMTREVRSSVAQFRHRTLTIVMHRAVERVRQQQTRKAFFKWVIQIMKQRQTQILLSTQSIQSQLKKEMEKSEKMIYWAVSMTRVECEGRTCRLLLQASFNRLRLQVVFKKRDSMKLNMETYKARVMFHIGKTVSCVLLRNRKQKLLRRFSHWRVCAHIQKSVELESKTAELRHLLLGAKNSAEDSIVQIIRDRLNRSPPVQYHSDAADNVRSLSPRMEFK